MILCFTGKTHSLRRSDTINDRHEMRRYCFPQGTAHQCFCRMGCRANQPCRTESKEEAILIEAMTREQSNCEHWHRYRSNRITASNFGRVVKRKAAVSEAFLTSIFKPKRFMSKATAYGTTTESLARRQYDSI